HAEDQNGYRQREAGATGNEGSQRTQGRGGQASRVAALVIALGVTGGIGAYKAVEVARGLQKRGHDVVAIMTHSARRFVGEVTFEAMTRRPVLPHHLPAGRK